MNVRSMTGFGRASAEFQGVRATIEIQSVNKRNLECNFSLPKECAGMERSLLPVIQKNIQRGKIHVALTIENPQGRSSLDWDSAGLEHSLERLRELASRLQMDWPPSTEALVQLIALHPHSEVCNNSEMFLPEVIGVLEDAIHALNQMRLEEGTALVKDLWARLDQLRKALVEIEKNGPDRVQHYRSQLLQRLASADLNLDLDDERVLKEIAIFADKCDVTEEITRLKSHCEQLEESLQAGSPIGRKLEFILQEVNREFNTVGSKANGIEISRVVIDAKNEIERMREQVQNIE